MGGHGSQCCAGSAHWSPPVVCPWPLAAVPLAVGFGSAVSRAGRLLPDGQCDRAQRTPGGYLRCAARLLRSRIRSGWSSSVPARMVPEGYCSASWAGEECGTLGDLGLAHNLVRDIRRDRDRDARCDRGDGRDRRLPRRSGVVGRFWGFWTGVGVAVRCGRWAGLGADLVAPAPGGGPCATVRNGRCSGFCLSLCAHRTVWRAYRRAQRPLAVFMAGALAIAPLAFLPDLVGWPGQAGRPASTQRNGTICATSWRRSPRRDVLSLPRAAFRRYAWNDDDIVLDPLPRYLTRTVVWNDRLPVTVSGELVEVGGDEPRAAAISGAINEGRVLAPLLADLGIRWIVVQTDQPLPALNPDLSGTSAIWQQDGLILREVTGPIAEREPRDAVVVAVDSSGALLLVVLGWWAVVAGAIPTGESAHFGIVIQPCRGKSCDVVSRRVTVRKVRNQTGGFPWWSRRRNHRLSRRRSARNRCRIRNREFTDGDPGPRRQAFIVYGES